MKKDNILSRKLIDETMDSLTEKLVDAKPWVQEVSPGLFCIGGALWTGIDGLKAFDKAIQEEVRKYKL